MSRKHYIALARALAENRPSPWADTAEFRAAWDAWFGTVQSIASVLQADNYRFDRSRFMAAVVQPDARPIDMVTR